MAPPGRYRNFEYTHGVDRGKAARIGTAAAPATPGTRRITSSNRSTAPRFACDHAPHTLIGCPSKGRWPRAPLPDRTRSGSMHDGTATDCGWPDLQVVNDDNATDRDQRQDRCLLRDKTHQHCSRAPRAQPAWVATSRTLLRLPAPRIGHGSRRRPCIRQPDVSRETGSITHPWAEGSAAHVSSPSTHQLLEAPRRWPQPGEREAAPHPYAEGVDTTRIFRANQPRRPRYRTRTHGLYDSHRRTPCRVPGTDSSRRSSP